MSAQTQASPAIGVLDTAGLRPPDGSLAPVTGAIRHVGDLYNGARRHGLTQLWLTDAWVRTAGLPTELAVAGQFRLCATSDDVGSGRGQCYVRRGRRGLGDDEGGRSRLRAAASHSGASGVSSQPSAASAR